MKNKFYIIIMALLVSTGAVAYAETATTTKPIQPRKAFVEEKKEIRENAVQNIKATRAETRAEIAEKASTTKALLQEKRDDIRENREETRDQIEEKRKEMVRKIFDNQFRRVGTRLEATITRVEGIATRVNARIEKVKNAGGKTETAEKYLAEARTHLTEARAELAKMKVAGDNALTNISSTTPRAMDMQNIKSASKTVEKHIQEAHKALEKSVGSLRGMSTTSPNASSTNTTN